MSTHTTIILLTTLPDQHKAELMARALVQEKLAACAHIREPHKAIYAWEGTLRTESEVTLILKTTPEREEVLRSRIVELHPYDTPAILSWPAQANTEYAAWTRSVISSNTP